MVKISLMGTLVILLLTPQVSFAESIYKKKQAEFPAASSEAINSAEALDQKPQDIHPVVSNKAPVQTAPSVMAAPVVKNLPNEIPVRMRIEESFDANGDRKLQTTEIKTLLKHIIVQVKANGKHPVNSDLLSIHDVNQDGVITPNELAPFEAFTR